nr:hypothetical protein [Planctomycetota bacterium]
MLRDLCRRWRILVVIWTVVLAVPAIADESATIDVPLLDDNLRQLVQGSDWEAAIAAVDKALAQQDAQRDRLTYLKGRILHFQEQY